MTIFGNPQCPKCGMTYNIVQGRNCSCELDNYKKENERIVPYNTILEQAHIELQREIVKKQVELEECKTAYDKISEHNKGLNKAHLQLINDRKEQPTLRDQFAMSALVVLCGLNCSLNGKDSPDSTDHAIVSYRMADAMLKARGEG